MAGKTLTLTHINRIIGEQIYVGDRFWTISDVVYNKDEPLFYRIEFREGSNVLGLSTEIRQHYQSDPYVMLNGVGFSTADTFRSPIALKEMGDMTTFLDALADRVNGYVDKWNGV